MNKTLIASDGLEYENLTQRLLGVPADNARNKEILSIRRLYAENEARAYVEAYDRARGRHSDKYAAGWAAISRERRSPKSC